MISTRGRYALRVMIDLAENCNGEYIPMKEVASRQGISLKYLERILPELTKCGMLDGIHGKGGGYRLKKAPAEYTVGDILRAAEGDLAPIACLSGGAQPCCRTAECRTRPMWEEYKRLTDKFFDGITIAQLMETQPENTAKNRVTD